MKDGFPDFLYISAIAQISPIQVQSTWSKTLSTRAEASPSRGRRQNGGEVPCWRAPLELLGTDVCGDCSPLDPLLGSGTTLVEFPRFALLRCLVSLPFRADGIDILVIEVL